MLETVTEGDKRRENEYYTRGKDNSKVTPLLSYFTALNILITSINLYKFKSIKDSA